VLAIAPGGTGSLPPMGITTKVRPELGSRPNPERPDFS